MALDEKAIIAEADQRIEKYRKADGVVEVLDAAGKPVVGATVRIEQTRHAFRFGSNIFRWGQCDTPEHERLYRQRFSEVFNFATLPFYWWGYEVEQGKPAHAQREQVARWCVENGIAPKGHPLAWNHSEAKWLPDDPDRIMALQLDRIDDCVKRFKGLIDRWDVVNEAVAYDRESFAKRAPRMTAAWSKIGQVEFTKRCFESARKANPEATLLINDYRVDQPYEKLIEQLVDGKGKRLYDVIGIQSHMHGRLWPVAKVWDVCERFARFKVPLHFTETTLVSGKQGWDLTTKDPAFEWVSTPIGETRQAEQTALFYTILFSHPAVEAITWWDFTDQRSWMKAPAGWLDKEMKPKPVFKRMKGLIKGTWWTQLDTASDKGGQVRFRGFKGNYRVTVRTSGGRSAEARFELPAKSPWVVRLK